MANPPFLSPAAHNPDVLSCLANLSNDEVFTPPDVANAMLDLLPQELFASKQTKFLDPVCKTGVFLREIAKRLMFGLATQIPDPQQRIDHILHHQLFGIAITELASLIARRTLYCAKYATSPYAISKFTNIDGNIRFKNIQHTWKNGRCTFCGTSQAQYDRPDDLETHAYEFIHTPKPQEIFNNMKFDVIIGNPPYQLSDGGSGTGISSKPIYHHFIKMAKQLSPRYIVMITPSRWFAGGKGLDEFRNEALNDNRFARIVDFPKSRECFPGVDIAGGVSYFLWDINKTNDKCEIVITENNQSDFRERSLNEFPIFVRYNIAIDILHKILPCHEAYMNTTVLSRNPFGLIASERGTLEASGSSGLKLISSGGQGYVPLSKITKNILLKDKYKVIIGKVNPDRGGVNNSQDGKSNVITKIRILNPEEICTETYLVLNSFDDLNHARNCSDYFSTKLIRFLILITLSSMNITKENFQFVPVQDFSKSWTDAELYAKYGLTQEEIDFIEATIKPMEISLEQEQKDG